MTGISPELQDAIEQLKDNLLDAVEKGAAVETGFQKRASDNARKTQQAQQSVTNKIVSMLDEARKWDSLPQEIDARTKAALLYYVQTERMAESHFKNNVMQEFVTRWNGDEANNIKGECRDPQIVREVNEILQDIQADVIALNKERQQLLVEREMAATTLPYPPQTPLLRTVAAQTANGDWQVAFLPFYIDQNMELQTDNLPFEYHVGAYIKGEGIADNFNAQVNIRRLDTSKDPSILTFKAERGQDIKTKRLYVMGHVEQQGKHVGSIAMPALPLQEFTDTGVGVKQPTPQGGNGNGGPRVLN